MYLNCIKSKIVAYHQCNGTFLVLVFLVSGTFTSVEKPTTSQSDPPIDRHFIWFYIADLVLLFSLFALSPRQLWWSHQDTLEDLAVGLCGHHFLSDSIHPAERAPKGEGPHNSTGNDTLAISAISSSLHQGRQERERNSRSFSR